GVRTPAEVDVNASIADTLGSIFSPPTPGRDFADIRSGGYGLAFAWLVLPIAALGLGRAIAAARRSGPRASRARRLLCIGGLVSPSVVLTPALWSARYQL